MRFRVRIQENLHGADGAGVFAGPDDADGKFAPGQICFHQHRLAESLQESPADRAQAFRIVDSGAGGDAFARAFRDRFGKKGIRQQDAPDVFRRGNHGKVRSGNAQIPHNMFGHAFMKRQRLAEGVREGVGDPVGVQKRGDLRLPAKTVHSFGDVEDKVPAVARGQTARERLHVADAVGGVAVFLQDVFNGFDGVGLVELGGFFEAVSFAKVIVAQVVGQADG